MKELSSAAELGTWGVATYSRAFSVLGPCCDHLTDREEFSG